MMTFDEFAEKAFHAYDIRIAAADLTEDFALRLYQAQARYFKNVLHSSKIVLCRDTRKSGAYLLETAVNFFCKAGFKVDVNVLPVSTCQFYFSCMKRPDSCGIMFTASHNPAHYAGLKIVGPMCLPIAADIGPEGGLNAIKKALLDDNLPEESAGGSVCVFNDADLYIESCMTRAGIGEGFLSGIRVCADFLCGSAGSEIARALKKAGVELTVRNIVPNGDFPAGSPNPVIKANIQKTIDFMSERPGAFDFGLFFDGDGDRIDICTGSTEEISPSLIMLFIVRALGLSGEHPYIGIDAKASPYIAWELKKAGFEPVLIPNGHSKIKDLFLRAGVQAAVEESAHYYIRSLLSPQNMPRPVESTLFICLLFLSEWKKNNDDFLRLLDLQHNTYRKREWSHSYASDADRSDTLAESEAFFCQQGYEAVKTLFTGEPLGAVLLEKKWDGGNWCRVAQRSSESEQGLARWMVSSSDKDELEFVAENIEKIALKRAK
ncbi:MAG: hypothetical protein ACTTKC_05340 [Treponema sp.]